MRKMCSANIRAYIPVLLITFFAVVCVNTNKKPLYGPYRYSLSEVRLCQGSRKWINTQVKIELRNKTDGRQELYVNTTIYGEVGPIGFRVKFSAGDGGRQHNLINYVFMNACEHFLIGNILKNLPGFTDQCFLEKGNFSYVISNVDAMSHTFFGSQFFYGTYKTRTQLFTVKEQVICLDMNFQVIPL